MSKEILIHSTSPHTTLELGKSIGKGLAPGDVIALIGELGAGKTVFTKGIALGLGIKGDKIVVSPSFTLVNRYFGKIPLYHIDLYRLNSSSELKDLGLEEFIYGNGVTVIEWAQKFPEILPQELLEISFEILGEKKRGIKIKPIGKQ